MKKEIQPKAKEETTPIQENGATDLYKAAVELHCQVMISKEQVETALCSFAMNLKKMRDGKQYEALGYESFADYVERGVNIEIRQVYTYISAYEKLGSDVLQSNARLGITKLSLLGTVPDIERAEFIEDNDLEGMSVKEIRALIKQSKKQIEQISLLNTEIENQKADLEQLKLEDEANADYKSQAERLSAELETLKAKPIDVAVAELSEADIEKIKADAALAAEKTIKADYEAKRKQDIKDAVATATANATDKAKKDVDKLIATAKTQAASEAAEQFKQSLADTESEKAAAIEQAQKLAKELKIAVDGDMATMQFYFNEFSELFSKITAKIADINKTDTEKAAGLNGAVSKLLKILTEQVEV